MSDNLVKCSFRYILPQDVERAEMTWWGEAGDSIEKAQEAIKADYQRRIDAIVADLKRQFPKSSYIDDLLFSSYFLSRKPSYLKVMALLRTPAK